MTEVNRRNVAKGLAWSVPAVALASAAPVFAASQGPGPDPEPPVELVRIPTTGWAIDVSSETNLAGYNTFGGMRQHAFDGVEATFWHSYWTSAPPTPAPDMAQPPHWIQALSPVPVTVSQVRIMHRRDSERYRTATVLVSNDGASWDIVATGEHTTAGTGGDFVWYTFDFPAVATRFVRITTGTDGTFQADQHFVLREVEFWG